MAKEQPYSYIRCRDFTPGLNTLDDPIDLADGESPYILNMDITKRGAMITRFGYELAATIGGGATGAMRGLQTYYRTYDDSSPVDQSADTGAAYANTYTLPTSISELAADKLTFTPTKSAVTMIGLYVVSKGTGNWTVTLHDASNNQLAQFTLNNAELTNSAFNYFRIPYTWSSGALHIHVTTNTGTSTLKCNIAADLSTASYIEVYSTKGDYLVLHHSNGNSYYVTNTMIAAGTAPTLIDTYGTDSGPVRGTTFNNYAIFGNGYYSNVVKKWNGAAMTSVGGSPPRANIFNVFQKRIFMSGDDYYPYAVNYSEVDDSETGYVANVTTFTKGDGQDVTAMISNNDFMQVFKEDSIQGMNFSFDADYNLTLPQQQPIVNSQGGAYATGSVQATYGYTYYLSKKGVETYGPTPERIVADQPLPLSLKIEPTIKTINFAQRENIVSAFFDQKYLLSCPLGASTTNNYTLVFNESIKRRFGKDNWTMYDDIPAAAYSIFRDSSKIDQLYFASQLEPKVFKFNNSFSDNNSGYNRLWRSKTFQFGERTQWAYIDIEGAMVDNGKLYVDLVTDQITVAGIEITSANFITAGGGAGGYIGYSYIGDLYIGGAFYGSVPTMYRFKKRIWFPQGVNYGYNMYFQVRNNADGEGWALNRYVLAYRVDPETPTYNRAD